MGGGEFMKCYKKMLLSNLFPKGEGSHGLHRLLLCTLGPFFLKISTDSKASESLRKYEICQKSKSLLFGSIANANVQDIQKLIQFAMGKITSKNSLEIRPIIVIEF